MSPQGTFGTGRLHSELWDWGVNLYSSLNRDFIPQIRSPLKDLTVNPIFISLEKVSF